MKRTKEKDMETKQGTLGELSPPTGETPKPVDVATEVPTAAGSEPAPETKAEPTAALAVAAEIASKAPVAAKPEEPEGMLSAFASETNFAAGQRIAMALSKASLVPAEYKNNIPNILIAMELANRIGASVLMVMQNLNIIHNRPSWGSAFLIATVNASKRFTPIRFVWQGTEGKDDWGCRAIAKDAKTGEECRGALITIGTAKAEGWYQKPGSKWKTIPEQMLMYRSAAFWTRVYAPEISLGIQTAEEVEDVWGSADAPAAIKNGDPKALEAELLKPVVQPAAV